MRDINWKEHELGYQFYKHKKRKGRNMWILFMFNEIPEQKTIAGIY